MILAPICQPPLGTLSCSISTFPLIQENIPDHPIEPLQKLSFQEIRMLNDVDRTPGESRLINQISQTRYYCNNSLLPFLPSSEKIRSSDV